MFYHVKVQFSNVNENGATIKEKHEVLVDNCEFFAEAETKALDEFINDGDGDVEVAVCAPHVAAFVEQSAQLLD